MFVAAPDMAAPLLEAGIGKSLTQSNSGQDAHELTPLGPSGRRVSVTRENPVSPCITALTLSVRVAAIPAPAVGTSACPRSDRRRPVPVLDRVCPNRRSARNVAVCKRARELGDTIVAALMSIKGGRS